MPKIREIIAGKKCVIYADEQPQVLLIQPVGEHENATLDAEIEAIREAVRVPFVFAGFAISDWEEELTPWHDQRRGMTRISLHANRLVTIPLRRWAISQSN